MPVDRMTFQQTNTTVSELVRHVSEGEMDMDMSYQRGHVWDIDRKRKLVLSLRQGLPVGVLFLNRRSHTDPMPRLVDGKQRLSALHEFLSDGFSVPADWFVETDPRLVDREGYLPNVDPALANDEIVFSQLAEPGRLRFKMAAIACYWTMLPTEADEAELFDRINFGGIAPEPRD